MVRRRERDAASSISLSSWTSNQTRNRSLRLICDISIARLDERRVNKKQGRNRPCFFGWVFSTRFHSAVARPVATSNSSIAGISIARDAKKYAATIETKTRSGLPSMKLVAA